MAIISRAGVSVFKLTAVAIVRQVRRNLTTHASKEALWLRSFISQIFDPITEPITLFSDHQYHARTKHIDIRHFIRWIIEEFGKLRLIFCPTGDMLADTLTKALPSPKVKHFASQLGLRAA